MPDVAQPEAEQPKQPGKPETERLEMSKAERLEMSEAERLEKSEAEPPETPDTELSETDSPEAEEQEQAEHPAQQAGFWSRAKTRVGGWIQAVKRFLVGIKERLSGLWQQILGIRDKVRNFFEKVQGWKNRLTYIKNYIEGLMRADYTRPALAQIVSQLKVLLRHLKPKKFSIWVHYGTGDPYTLGQHLTYISILYGFFGEYLTVEPDWDEKILEAKGNVKGRIRIFTLLRICIKVIKDKNIKSLWNEIRKFERS